LLDSIEGGSLSTVHRPNHFLCNLRPGVSAIFFESKGLKGDTDSLRQLMAAILDELRQMGLADKLESRERTVGTGTSLTVRRLTDAERARLVIEAGLPKQSPDIRQVCQIILASARGDSALQIAVDHGCSMMTVNEVIEQFNATGLDSWFKAVIPAQKSIQGFTKPRKWPAAKEAFTAHATVIGDWTVWTDLSQAPISFWSDDNEGMFSYTRIWAEYHATTGFEFSIRRKNFFERYLSWFLLYRSLPTGYPAIDREYLVLASSKDIVSRVLASPRVRSLLDSLGSRSLMTMHRPNAFFADLPHGVSTVFFEVRLQSRDKTALIYDRTDSVGELIAEILDELHRLGLAEHVDPAKVSGHHGGLARWKPLRMAATLVGGVVTTFLTLLGVLGEVLGFFSEAISLDFWVTFGMLFGGTAISFVAVRWLTTLPERVRRYHLKWPERYVASLVVLLVVTAIAAGVSVGVLFREHGTGHQSWISLLIRVVSVSMMGISGALLVLMVLMALVYVALALVQNMIRRSRRIH
jgi:hypothetical protein